MIITKYGHCCLLIETNGRKILTDPGIFSTEQNAVKDIDIILISHEHADHFHIDSIKAVMSNNPQATIVTNKSVGALLEKEGFEYALIGDGQSATIKDILIEGFGTKHAYIYTGVPEVENTAYMIDKILYYPGDNFHNPGKPVEILGLPVAGPWMKTADALDFAKEIKPKKIFPVHDAIMKDPSFSLMWAKQFLPKEGIEVVEMPIGEPVKL